MQVKNGTSVLGNEDEEARRLFDKTGTFSAIQLGEWGYHFHRLQWDRDWWGRVLGKDFDAQVDHFIKPKDARGYEYTPATRRECYDQLKEYFQWHLQSKRGRTMSVTGNSHYESYAAEWGARVVGLELAENIPFTQSKMAFARGASRQWGVPWTIQISPWFGGAVTTSGPLNTEGDVAHGLDAGHSLSLYKRMWKHGWFAGTAMVTPEASFGFYFEQPQEPWTLTSHGKAAAEAFQFMRSHDRGTPYTPLAVVLDHYAGYCPYHTDAWGVLPKTPGDQEIYDLFEIQISKSPQRLAVPGNPENPEARFLHPTRYGELCDVFLSTVPASIMQNYPVILLAGDVEFPKLFANELVTAAASGSRILVRPRHVKEMGQEVFSRIDKAGEIEVLGVGVNAETKRPAAISNARLRKIAATHMPIAVEGDPIQYQINRNEAGWVIELVNNDGVVKENIKPAVVYPTVIAKVKLTPRFQWDSAREWMTDAELAFDKTLTIEVPPGDSRFVSFSQRRELKTAND